MHAWRPVRHGRFLTSSQIRTQKRRRVGMGVDWTREPARHLTLRDRLAERRTEASWIGYRKLKTPRVPWWAWHPRADLVGLTAGQVGHGFIGQTKPLNVPLPLRRQGSNPHLFANEGMSRQGIRRLAVVVRAHPAALDTPSPSGGSTLRP